ncbi:hypothetical protein CKF54_07645 [Psittacicella hinzii]|uniref:Uncharacterized protein n=1 Tax=Psittacicella hinzii TaxID=2028575 RepID=A0A3A1XYJ9_9GAMM|nr:hypothetical protein [Psittacicella hinzii]RIY31102.1 hypothetical protein CKF54_07645 [Psittacicella hinzii]
MTRKKFLLLLPLLALSKQIFADTITFYVEPVKNRYFLNKVKPSASQAVPWFVTTAQGIDITCQQGRSQIRPATFPNVEVLTIVYDGVAQNLPEGSAASQAALNKVNLTGTNFKANNFAWKIQKATVYAVNNKDSYRLYNNCEVNFSRKAEVEIAGQANGTVKITKAVNSKHIPTSFAGKVSELVFYRCSTKAPTSSQAKLYLSYNGQEYVATGLTFVDEKEQTQYCAVK